MISKPNQRPGNPSQKLSGASDRFNDLSKPNVIGILEGEDNKNGNFQIPVNDFRFLALTSMPLNNFSILSCEMPVIMTGDL